MTKEQKIIKAKVGLLELAKQLGNVSQACKIARLFTRGGGRSNLVLVSSKCVDRKITTAKSGDRKKRSYGGDQKFPGQALARHQFAKLGRLI
jgi:hypothetical protein